MISLESNSLQQGNYHHTNPLTRVPVTWRSSYEWNRIKLSFSMKDALRLSINTGETQQLNRRTQQALKDRGLIKDDHLTCEGRTVAISLLGLTKQCKYLDIPIKALRLPRGKKPELAVMDEIAKLGRKVAFCEGGAITLLLYCLCFERIYQLYIQLWGSEKDARSYMYTGMMSYSFLLEKHLNLADGMIADIANTNEPTMLRAFDILKVGKTCVMAGPSEIGLA